MGAGGVSVACWRERPQLGVVSSNVAAIAASRIGISGRSAPGVPCLAMGRPMSAATKFVLSLPPDLPVKEVIAKARANGIELAPGNVYRIRRLPPMKAAAKVSGRPSSRPVAAARATDLSKSEFIRSISADTPAKEVVVRARAAGLAFDQTYVYKIRAAAQKKTASTKPSTRAATMTTGRVTREAELVPAHASPTPEAIAPRSRVAASDEATARPRDAAPTSNASSPGIWAPNADFEAQLASLDDADTAIRVMYAEPQRLPRPRRRGARAGRAALRPHVDDLIGPEAPRGEVGGELRGGVAELVSGRGHGGHRGGRLYHREDGASRRRGLIGRRRRPLGCATEARRRAVSPEPPPAPRVGPSGSSCG